MHSVPVAMVQLEWWLQTGGDSNTLQWDSCSLREGLITRCTSNCQRRCAEPTTLRENKRYQALSERWGLPVQNSVILRKTSVRGTCPPLLWAVLPFAAFPFLPRQTRSAWPQSGMYAVETSAAYSCAQQAHRCFCQYFLSCQHWHWFF